MKTFIGNEEIKTFRVCKQQRNRFYGVFTIERRNKHEKEVKKVEKTIKKMKKVVLKRCVTTIRLFRLPNG